MMLGQDGDELFKGELLRYYATCYYKYSSPVFLSFRAVTDCREIFQTVSTYTVSFQLVRARIVTELRTAAY